MRLPCPVKNPPPQIDAANVVCFVILSEKQRQRETPPDWFSNLSEERSSAMSIADAPVFIVHYVEGEAMQPPAALAICQYGGREDRGTYLFYSDAHWETMQDDLFDSIEEALQQGCVQYEGLRREDWQWVKKP